MSVYQLDERVKELEEKVRQLQQTSIPLVPPPLVRNGAKPKTKWYQEWVQCEAKLKVVDKTFGYECPDFPFICMHDSQTEFPFQWLKLPAWVKNARVELDQDLPTMHSDGNTFWSVPNENAPIQGGLLIDMIPSDIEGMRGRLINTPRLQKRPIIRIDGQSNPLGVGKITIELLTLEPCLDGVPENNFKEVPRFGYDVKKVVLSRKLIHTED